MLYQIPLERIVRKTVLEHEYGNVTVEAESKEEARKAVNKVLNKYGMYTRDQLPIDFDWVDTVKEAQLISEEEIEKDPFRISDEEHEDIMQVEYDLVAKEVLKSEDLPDVD